MVVSGVIHSPCPAPSSSRPGNSQATDPLVPACAVARYRAASPRAAVTAPTASQRLGLTGPGTGSGRGGTGDECTIEVVVRPCGVNRSRIGSRSSIECRYSLRK